MPLSYDPKDALGFVPKGGTYRFRVLSCAETTFSSGTRGLRVQLEVDAGAPAPLHCWDNVVFGPRTTWRMLDLCKATGVRFDPPCEAADLLGKAGTAEFVTDEWEGFVRLKVMHYVARGGNRPGSGS